MSLKESLGNLIQYLYWPSGLLAFFGTLACIIMREWLLIPAVWVAAIILWYIEEELGPVRYEKEAAP